MRMPSIPGPRDIVSLMERSGEQLAGLLPRVTDLLGRAERLVADVGALVERIETTRAEAQLLLARADATRARAEVLVTGIEPTVERVAVLLDGLEPSLTKLQPTLDRLAETTDPREVDAMIAMVDQLPLLAAKVDTDVLPMLETLSSVAPDLHDLLDVSRELNLMLEKLPGMGRIKKRVEEAQEDEARDA